MRLLSCFLFACLSIVSAELLAQCSPYVTKAVLNEVFLKPTGGRNKRAHIEVKILDTTLTANDFKDWKVTICSGSGCSNFLLSSMTDDYPNKPWLYIDYPTLPINAIDFNGGFDITFTDQLGNVIDAIQVGNTSWQTISCDSLAYEYSIPTTTNGTKLVKRSPDGTGPWKGISANPTDTPGENNDGNSSSYPYLSIADLSVLQGDNAEFIVSLLDKDGAVTTSTTPITFRYKTIDNTAIAGTHYNGVTLVEVILPANTSSMTLPVIPTTFIGDTITRLFSLFIDGSADANITDGLAIATITPRPKLIANYKMEEISWGTTSGEVIDETGNFSSRSVNGANTAGVSSAIVGDPGTCRYGEFDGVNDYIEVPSSFDNLQDSFTITAWIKPSNLDPGSRIFIDDEKNSGGFGFSLGDPGQGRLRFYSRAVRPISVDTGAVISKDVWTFVTAVHNSVTKTRQIYVNGVAQTITSGGTSHTYTGNWGTDTGPATIGGETDLGETSNRFTGNIDEVRIYSGALSSVEINVIYLETHPCAAPIIDHFEIIHDGNGLTCEAETVTIKACTNSFGNTCTESTESVSLDLVVTDPTSVESARVPISFTGNGTASFNHAIAATVKLSIENASISATSDFVCNDDSAGSCDMAFADAGFRFLYGASEVTTIGSQVSGDLFKEVLKLQAVKDNNGVCEGIFTGNVDVELAQQNVIPDFNGTSGLNFNVNGNSIAKYPNFTPNVTLNFGSDSKAVITDPKYLDAGNISLQARYTDASITLVGSSNAFWVQPANLILSATSGTNNINGIDENSPSMHVAGNNFDLKVTAVNRNGDITQNYRQGQLQLKLERVLPTIATSVDGQLTYATSSLLTSATSVVPPIFTNVVLTAFDAAPLASGVSAFTGAQYSEVGIINLDVQDIDYGGEDLLIEAADINIGRFTPAYFIQTIEEGNEGVIVGNHSLTCPIESWVYSGQQTGGIGSIEYLKAPQLSITAYNANDDITKNYIDAFIKLENDDVILSSPITTHVNTLALTGDVSANGIMSSKGLGVVEYTLSSLHNFTYTRNNVSKVMPFDAAFEIPILSIMDSDGIQLKPSVGGMEYFYNPLFSTVTPSGASTINNTLNIRFGRWYIENGFGPETEDLPLLMQIQQFNGLDFDVNSDEHCLIPTINNPRKSGAIFSGSLNLWDYRLADEDITDSLQIGDSNVSLSGSFVLGENREFIFSAPPASGKQGSLKVEYEVSDWLKFDWNNIDENLDTNFYDDNPTAIATFGLFRGNDRIIYWREVLK